MAAINFPSSPTQGQSYTENGQTWYYDGVKWVSGGTFGQSALTPMYQQGTWTPTMASGSGSYNTGSADHLIWHRIGNQVTIQGYMPDIAAGGVSDQAILVEGLPYQQGTDSALGSVMSSNFGVVANASYISSNQLSFFASGNTTGWLQVKTSDRTNSSAAVWFSITYQTSDTTWTPINGATVS